LRRNLAPRRLRWLVFALLLAATLLIALLAGGRLAPSASASALAASAADPVIAAAGDIACDPSSSNFNGGNGTANNCRMKYTSDLLLDPAISSVLLLGDNQYYCGGYQAWLQSYDRSWGRVKGITRPAPGNHEYLTSGGTDCNSANAGAAGYFRYFGAAAGDPAKGYYSYDVGSWHFIVLNSECTDVGGCGPTSPQGQWLRADLASHPNLCTLAYWHIPLFSSGGRASSRYKTFWDALYDADADVVLNGHDHTYERFAPQRPDGVADPVRGIREFVVGTGGSNHTSFTTIFANSEVRNSATYGVLRVTLRLAGYDWQFVPEAGKTFTDSGSGQCHGPNSDQTPPTAPTGLTANAQAPNHVTLSWTASTDNVGVTGYRVTRNGSVVATLTGTTYDDRSALPNTTYDYTVVAFDAGGNVSPASNVARATTPPDTTRPTAPANLTATAVGSSVSLAWTASTDNVGVSAYDVIRGGVVVGTSTTTSYSDAAVNPNTTYTYTVKARDASGNVSDPSNSVVITTPAAPTLLVFAPTADAYVDATLPTSNFGSVTSIHVDNSPVKHFLLKFSVTGVNGRAVTSAKLRLRCVDPATFGGEFHRLLDTSWGETTVNWNNAPAGEPAIVASLGSVVVGSTYEVDLPFVTGDGTYALRVVSTSTNGADYSSKEGSVPPQIVVSVSP
jgi:acid phosphatase type 7